MTLSWRKASTWAASTAITVLGALLTFGARELWTAKDAQASALGDLRGDVEVLKANRSNDHELLIEMRQDVKEILREVHK